MATSGAVEIEAINLMLSVIGESPVNSDEVDDNVDAVLARQILYETSKEVQAQNWHWNSMTNVKLVPDTDKHITIPDSYLQVDPIDPTMDLIVLSGRLTDRRDGNDEFKQPVRAHVTMELPLHECPPPAREYIKIRAARKFQDRIVGSQQLSGFNREDELRSFINLQNYDANLGDYNLMRDSWDVGRILNRNGVPGPRVA